MTHQVVVTVNIMAAGMLLSCCWHVWESVHWPIIVVCHDSGDSTAASSHHHHLLQLYTACKTAKKYVEFFGHINPNTLTKFDMGEQSLNLC